MISKTNVKCIMQDLCIPIQHACLNCIFMRALMHCAVFCHLCTSVRTKNTFVNVQRQQNPTVYERERIKRDQGFVCAISGCRRILQAAYRPCKSSFRLCWGSTLNHMVRTVLPLSWISMHPWSPIQWLSAVYHTAEGLLSKECNLPSALNVKVFSKLELRHSKLVLANASAHDTSRRMVIRVAITLPSSRTLGFSMETSKRTLSKECRLTGVVHIRPESAAPGCTHAKKPMPQHIHPRSSGPPSSGPNQKLYVFPTSYVTFAPDDVQSEVRRDKPVELSTSRFTGL
jgi:hypothetical protein